MASNQSFTPPTLRDILRTTLRRLEESEELTSSDPALVELKSSLVRAIGEIELKKMASRLGAVAE